MKKADDKLYERHAGDRRPNALYDANGNRRPLDPDAPEQAELLHEWIALYNESMEADVAAVPSRPDSGSSHERPVADPVERCPNKHWITIRVVPRPDSGPRPDYWAPLVGNAFAAEPFNAQLPNGQKSGKLDGSGAMRFDDIPAGACQWKMDKFFKAVTDYFEREAVFIPPEHRS